MNRRPPARKDIAMRSQAEVVKFPKSLADQLMEVGLPQPTVATSWYARYDGPLPEKTVIVSHPSHDLHVLAVGLDASQPTYVLLFDLDGNEILIAPTYRPMEWLAVRLSDEPLGSTLQAALEDSLAKVPRRSAESAPHRSIA